jgi:DNA-binding beta-propeller fold protein YncE
MGILYDGSSIWATDYDAGTLLKLDPTGAILQTVGAGSNPAHPAFDGTNIWVPGAGGTVTVVRASTGSVLQVLTGNGLGEGISAAFDGQRIIATNFTTGGVSFFKAADLTPLGSAPAPTAGFHSYGACTDGLSFCHVLQDAGASLVLSRAHAARRAPATGPPW